MANARQFFAVILAIGTFYLASPTRVQAQLKPEDYEKLNIWKAEPLKVMQKDDELKRLLTQRYNEALTVVQLSYKGAIGGTIAPAHAHAAGWRLLNAGLEVLESPKVRAAFLKEIWELADIVERIEAVKVAADATRHPLEMHISRQFRLDVEIQMLKEKKRAKQADKQ